MTTRSALFTVLVLLLCSKLRADEGMWLPLLLNALESDMQEMGMKMSAEDIYSVNQGSLKDAIVHFGGICTGEIMSEDGLLLTNHHCGYSAIQSHSTLENNILKEGFWAMDRNEELPNSGLYATFIIRIEDVTEQALNGIPESASEQERQSAIDANLHLIRIEAVREVYQDVLIRSFIEGTQYFLFITETYRDVRLVGAPPESIGKFGGDTDNWEWPRHTGAFSIFRVYAGPDNKPAQYSPSNVPYHPRHALSVSTSGIKEGDFTLVLGFPGRTDQYLTSYAMKHVIEVINPSRIGIRDISLKIMKESMLANEASKLNLAPRYASIANYWKKWIGERQGLIKVDAIGKKEELESEFTVRIHESPLLLEQYGYLLTRLSNLYARGGDLEKARIYYSETFNVNIRLFQLISRMERLRRIYQNNGEMEFLRAVQQQRDWFADFYRTVDFGIDQKICAALLHHMGETLDSNYLPEQLTKEYMFMRALTYEELARQLYTEQVVTPALLDRIGEMDGAQFSEALQAEPAYQLFSAAKMTVDSLISPSYHMYATSVNALQRDWVIALMEVFPEKRFWPDANGTLRVSYGLVEGYQPRDGVAYEPVTYLDGVIEKYQPGDYEFDVHPRLLELYENKDYGPYADPETGKVPVCFLGSNHTTGGSSGSPVIDAYGNLIGINFDRVWEGTMSDLNYDRSLCRNIMLDIRYILFIVDKFAGAGHLIDEMKLVTAEP